MAAIASTFGFGGGTGVGISTTATISSTSVAAGYSAASLAARSLSPVLRSVTGVVVNWQIDVDYGVGVTQDIGIVVLGGTNLPVSGSVWRVRAGNDATFATNLLDSGSIAAFDTTYRSSAVPPGGRNAVYIPTASQSCRYLRLLVTGGGSLADNFLRASYLIAGSLEQPNRGFDKTSFTRGLVTQGEGTAEVTLRTIVATMFRAFKGDEVFLLEQQRRAGKNGRLYVVPQPLAPATFLPDAFLAHFSQDVSSVPVPQLVDRYAVTVGFQESDQ